MVHDDDREKGNEVLAARRAHENSITVKLQVTDMAHAKSEEVMRFCVARLQEGATWNELRRMLGLGPAAVDKKWRTIKEMLCSAVMPATDEEAMAAAHSMSNYMSHTLEQFVERIEERAKNSQGAENEHAMLKVQLDAIKLQMELYQKRFEHFADLKKIKAQDQGQHGKSIIFQNNYFVPRPGNPVPVEFENGKPVIHVPMPEEDGAEVPKLAAKEAKLANGSK